MRTELLNILAGKPEMINSFPEWMLPPETIEQCLKSNRIAIAEIAGRDSVAAVLEAAEALDLEDILPTIAYTGTEYGSWDTPFRAIELLRAAPAMKNIRIFHPVFLGSPNIWWQLCGRHNYSLVKDFGFYTPCIGCHLYFHGIRIPLAKILNCSTIIAGERESHDGRIKINQLGIALDAYIELAEKFDVELLLPLRNVDSGDQVIKILGSIWEEGSEQLGCVLSKNYVDRDGIVLYSEDAIVRFLREFALPLAEKMIRENLTNFN